MLYMFLILEKNSVVTNINKITKFNILQFILIQKF